MHSKDTLSQGIRWAVLGKLLGQIISWSSTILVIRLLSPADYGIVALASAPIGLFSIICGLGLDEVIVRKKEIDDRYQRRALGALVLFNGLFYVLILLLSHSYASYLDAQQLQLLLPVLGLQLLIGCFSYIPSALLERQLQIRAITQVEVTALIVGGLCSLLLAYNGLGVWALVISTLANQLTRSIGLSLAARPQLMPSFAIKPLLSDLGFAGNVLANKVVWYLNQTLDDLLIGKLLGQQQLGYYSVGKNFALLPLQKIAGIIHQISFPSIAHSETSDHSRDLILKGLSLICFTTFAVFFGVAAVSEPLTALLFGAKWLDVASVLALLSLLMPVKTINNFIGTATSALGHPGVRLRSQLIILATTLTAVVLGYEQGLERALQLLLGGHYLILPLLLINYCRVLPVTLLEVTLIGGRHLLVSLTSFAFCMFVASGASGPLWMTLLLNCFIFGSSYLILARIFCRQDLSRLFSLIRHRHID
ncbi:MAG: oligosaccharide flippase family protein [Motiliproteus sp.]